LPSRRPISRYAEQAQLSAQFAVEVEAQASSLGVDLFQRYKDETDEEFHKWVVKKLKYGPLEMFLDSLADRYSMDYATDVAHKILETKLCAPAHKNIAKGWLASFPL
jgi:flavin-dependent dehydrogenase